MKKILLITFIALNAIANAQQKLGIVACGGKFEFNVPAYEDRATIGTINFATKEYKVFDTIQVESVQKVVLSEKADGMIFLAAQDSILQYQYNNESKSIQKTNQIAFSGIKTIEANQNYLVAGKWYGGGEYLVVYDASSMTKLFASTTIANEIKDVKIIQDTLVAVSYNLQGKVDGCAPWGCFSDSIGRIDVINLETGLTKKTIDLGANGIGDITLASSSFDKNFYSVSSKKRYICAFDQDFNLITDSVLFDLKSLLTKEAAYNYNLIYGINSVDSVSSIWLDPSTNKFTSNQKSILPVGNKEIYSPKEGFFALNSDFDTYGQVVIQGFALKDGLDTISVGISPESMVIGEFGPMGIYSSLHESKINSSIYANEIANKDYINLKLYNLNGVQIMESDYSKDLEVESLTNGVYILTAVDNFATPLKIKVIK